MKPKIKPSERINRRYLLIKADNKENVEKTILEYIGILGYAKAKPFFVDEPGKIILSIERKSLEDVRAAFEISPLDIKVIKVSGTIKGLSS